MANSILLTLLFLGISVGLFYIIPEKYRWAVLLLMSTIFYVSAGPIFFLLIFGSSLWTWCIAKNVEKNPSKWWLSVGIVPIVISLLIFKYFNFFSTSVSELLTKLGLQTDPILLKILMPLGISYYTFKLLSYIIDVYRKKSVSEKHFGHFLTYTMYFPQIVCGPIQRSEEFLGQLREGLSYDKEKFERGIRLIILGLYKKAVIANALLVVVDKLYLNPARYSGFTLFVGALLYSILIYCDFSGYSNIAIGASNLFGMKCSENFRSPYFSRNIREFWERWHISLSSWLRDYIYISLGGNRVGRIRHKLNLLITFLVSGLWHGANWTFILWGLIHGLWSALTPKKKKAPEETEVSEKTTLWRRVRNASAILLTFLGVTFAWIFFRAPDISTALLVISRIFGEFTFSIASIREVVLLFSGDSTAIPVFLTVLVSVILLYIFEYKNQRNSEEKVTNCWCAIMFAAVLIFGIFGASGFLYANF